VKVEQKYVCNTVTFGSLWKQESTEKITVTSAWSFKINKSPLLQHWHCVGQIKNSVEPYHLLFTWTLGKSLNDIF